MTSCNNIAANRKFACACGEIAAAAKQRKRSTIHIISSGSRVYGLCEISLKIFFFLSKFRINNPKTYYLDATGRGVNVRNYYPIHIICTSCIENNLAAETDGQWTLQSYVLRLKTLIESYIVQDISSHDY